MIEYTEKIYYLGIPWLTREVVAFAILILIALFAIIVLFCWRNIVYSSFANLVLGLLVIMVCIIVVEKNIQVDGNKVIIDNLEDKYYYKDKLLNAKENEKTEVEHITRRVFKYDDFYDTKKLIDEDGNEFKLNEEDTKFLKERGAK